MFLSGIDEAGLGPLLGPYCVGLATFEIEDREPSCLYDLLKGVVGTHGGDISPVVCDSKKLYTPQKGLEALEDSVLTFFCLLHEAPLNFYDFLSALMGQKELDSLKNTPWFHGMEQLSLPLCIKNKAFPEKARGLKKRFEERGTILTDLSLSFIPAGEFNLLLKKYGNKGTLCQSVVTPLLVKALLNEKTRITVDRQGGRRYYGDWLIDLMPGQPLRAVKERAEMSLYRSGAREIGFYVKGDSLALETALASLFAKYAREGGMILFNDYWQARCKGLGRTAGYYTDGQRFIKDLTEQGLMPLNRDILVRAK